MSNARFQLENLDIRVAAVRGVAVVALAFLLPALMSARGGREQASEFGAVTADEAPRLSDASVAAAEAVTTPEVEATPAAPSPMGDAAAGFEATAWSEVARGGLDERVLDLALAAAACAVRNGTVDAPSTLSVIDYSKPSTVPRLWIFDVATRALLYEELVSHGRGSGGNMATAFSNTPDSHQSSIGLFVTESTYIGRNGYSLRLHGLDAGFNDQARARAIVMHGAPYVSAAFAKTAGRLGRSHGCPAVRDSVARELIDQVKGGSLLFSYYPDQRWLDRSKYLNGCQG